jgi:hypothetical protein
MRWRKGNGNGEDAVESKRRDHVHIDWNSEECILLALQAGRGVCATNGPDQARTAKRRREWGANAEGAEAARVVEVAKNGWHDGADGRQAAAARLR